MHVMKRLVNDLVKIRVRSYYIYQCDLSNGIEHFRTPVMPNYVISQSHDKVILRSFEGVITTYT